MSKDVMVQVGQWLDNVAESDDLYSDKNYSVMYAPWHYRLYSELIASSSARVRVDIWDIASDGGALWISEMDLRFIVPEVERCFV